MNIKGLWIAYVLALVIIWSAVVCQAGKTITPTPLELRIAELERRVEELEKRPTYPYFNNPDPGGMKIVPWWSEHNTIPCVPRVTLTPNLQ